MSSQLPQEHPYILGLDIGVNSIGWVCLAAEPLGDGWEPTGLLHPANEMHRWPSMGVRIFPEGVSSFDTGDEEGRGVARRRARMMRRQTARRARRIRKTFHMLQEMGLLPAYPPGAMDAHDGHEEPARDALLKALDRDLARNWEHRMPAGQEHRAHDMLPYVLRKSALDEHLEDHELGRALYHLSQRRGFLSNRKDAESDERSSAQTIAEDGSRKRTPGKEPGLKEEMGELEAAIRDNGHRSLGEHLLWRVVEKGLKIRKLKTRRYMYRHEFEKLWSAQAIHRPLLMGDDAKKRLYRAIFRQRPLKNQSDKIGICSLEDGETQRIDEHGVLTPTRKRRRAPGCSLTSQRFRSLQRLNDIRLLDKGTGELRSLSDAERTQLLAALETRKGMSVKEIGEFFGWSNRKVGVQINYDDETGDALPGMWTNQQLLEIFRDRWKALQLEQREAIVLDLFKREDPEWFEEDPDDPEDRARDPIIVRAALAREGVWASLSATPSEAKQLVRVRLSSQYAGLSTEAMRRLIPLLEVGIPYKTAQDRLYRVAEAPALDHLPPVQSVFRALNNPIVTRSLTELRRVVNHLIPLYGKPVQVRIELTREVKKGRKGREQTRKAQADNRRLKIKAVDEYCRQRGIDPDGTDQYTRTQVDRIRLWHEQGFSCPYTGDQIAGAHVLSAETEIDHILPFSLSQDDSMANKVLVFAKANQEKGQRIPCEAFGLDASRWARIEDWVTVRKKNKSMSMPRVKLERIVMTEEAASEHLNDFRSRQLNDTGWASSWARRYLMRLYGGDVQNGIDPGHKRRILTSAGQVTAHLRRELGLDRLLKAVIDPNTPMPSRWSKRVDQRHHIVDALAVAWCGPSMHQEMSKAAEIAELENRRFFARLPEPWKGFEHEITASLRECVPSYRVDNRVRGPLHKETIYPPGAVTRGEIKSWQVVGTARYRQRVVQDSGNHHMLVTATDIDGKFVVDAKVVSAWEAAQRVKEARSRRKAGNPRETSAPYLRGPGRFTLAINEVVRVPSKYDEGWLARIVYLKKAGLVCLSPVHEARTPRSAKGKMDSPEKAAIFLESSVPEKGLVKSIAGLVRSGFSKVSVSPIGVLRPCRA